MNFKKVYRYFLDIVLNTHYVLNMIKYIYIYISIDSEPSEEDTYVLQELGFFKEHDDYPLLWSLCV